MHRTRTAAVGIGAVAAAAAATLYVMPSATAANARTLRLTSHLDTLQPVDVAPAGPSAGDSFYVGSHIVLGAQGRIGAACTLVTASQGGIKQCEVDFVLARGTITTRGLTDNAGTLVHLIVIGGTARFAHTRGSGTLVPTPTGSDVVLHLH
jgi:hypothetical protein